MANVFKVEVNAEQSYCAHEMNNQVNTGCKKCIRLLVSEWEKRKKKLPRTIAGRSKWRKKYWNMNAVGWAWNPFHIFLVFMRMSMEERKLLRWMRYFGKKWRKGNTKMRRNNVKKMNNSTKEILYANTSSHFPCS